MAKQVHVPGHVKSTWQGMTDLIVELTGAPVALMTRFTDPCIDVFVASAGEGQARLAGESRVLHHSGLYCETVVKTKRMLAVCNADEDEHWHASPPLNGEMVSYLGFPILLSGGELYGTLCVLDRVSRVHPQGVRNLLQHFCREMSLHLELSSTNSDLAEENRVLSQRLEGHQALQGFVTICANCKSIKDDKGNWQGIESFHPDAHFSHSICPSCRGVLYPFLT